MSVIPFRKIPSAGPRVFTWTDSETGAPEEQVTATPCRICFGDIAESEPISYDGRAWNHDKCMTSALAGDLTGAAWRILGSQLARRPMDFKTPEIRVIVGQLLRGGAGLPIAPWDPENFEE
jgi:hypothetical protein